jgi:hypothetical protein
LMWRCAVEDEEKSETRTSGPIHLGRRTAEDGCPHMSLWGIG